MRFLVALPHAGYLRNFESTLTLLVARGHDIVLALGSAGKPALREPDRRLAELESALPGLAVAPGIERVRAFRKEDRRGRELRSWLDYLRYFDPAFDRAGRLRERAAEAVSPRTIETTRAAAAKPGGLEALRAAVAAREAKLPVPEAALHHVAAHAPDAVLVSPLMQKGVPQAAYLRAARRLGVPCGLCVASWDNLTTSTLIHGDPDLVTVWNAFQRDEAVRLHGVRRERVAVIGSPLHDVWFDSEPMTSRADLCARVGLPDDRPYLLYVGSSPHIAPAEEGWIVRWAAEIRAAGNDDVTRASVLVRPHPHNRVQALPGIAVQPLPAGLVVGRAAQQEYFDTIHHAGAVVGVNTSAMIEAGIVGRGVHVLLSDRLRDAHEGRPHFDYLVSAGGGLVKTAQTVADHVAGLARGLRDEDALECRRRAARFLRAFLRPNGLDVPVTPLMVDALEALADRHAAATAAWSSASSQL
jgi:hypothetical protein